MKYVCPVFLLTIFVLWVLVNVIGFNFETGQSTVSYYITDLAGENEEQIDADLVDGETKGRSILADTYEFAEKVAGILRVLKDHPARCEIDRVAQAPGFDVNIIHVYDYRDDEAYNPEILGIGAACYTVENAHTGVETAPAPVTAHCPLRPANWQTDDEKGNKVGEHEGPASVLGGLAGKTQKVAQSYRASRYCQYDTDP